MSYPEHERLREVKRETQALHDFVEWLERRKHIHLRQLHTDYPVMEKLRELIAEFYDIDLEELGREKDLMVESLRLMQEPHVDPKA